jgi:hypothetical protein
VDAVPTNLFEDLARGGLPGCLRGPLTDSPPARLTGSLTARQVEVLISLFEDWAGVKGDAAMQFDWDDVEGNTRRRLAGLALEKQRQQESRRRKVQEKRGPGVSVARKKH